MKVQSSTHSRRAWFAVVSVVTAVSLVACSPGGGTDGDAGDASAAEQATIRALIPHPGEPIPFGLRTFAVVDDPQYLEDSEVAVDEIAFENFAEMALLVSRGRDAEMANGVGISSILPAWSGGEKGFRVIAVDTLMPIYQLLTVPDVTDIEGLKGQPLGTLSPTAAGTDALDILMASAGLAGEYDKTVVGAGSAAISALSSGAIKGVTYSPPLSNELESEGYNIVGDMADVLENYINGMTLINSEWAEANRPAVVAYLAALIEVGDWFKDPANEDAVVEYLQEKWASGGGGKISEETARAMYDFYITDGRLSFDGYAPQEAVEGNLGVSIWRDIVPADGVPADFVDAFDWSYLNEALESMGRSAVPEYTTFEPLEIELD